MKPCPQVPTAAEPSAMPWNTRSFTITAEIGRKEDALSKYEERLRAQYAALDALLSQLRGQTSFLQSGQS